jgi:hypothetical protein
MRLFTAGLICAGMLATHVSAGVITDMAILNGASQVPPNASTATGFATVTLDTTAHTLAVSETFMGLIGGPAAAAHIHCCAPAGANAMVAVGFPGFPAAISGTFNMTFNTTDATIYTAGFLTLGGGTAAGAEATLFAAMGNGQTYVNIHNAQFPGGEIRGQLVPEPATLAFAAAGLLLLAALRRRA